MAVSLDIPGGVIVVGAGSAGTALCRALTGAGQPIEAVVSRTAKSAEQLANAIGAQRFGTKFEHLESAAVVIVAVPDDVIEAVAIDIASQRDDWSGCTVCHLSGALPSAVLSPFAERGASTGSLHPMLSIRKDSPPSVFDGVRFNVEGDAGAVRICSDVARAVGGTPFVVDAESKLLIHLSASILSNYLVTLAAVGTGLLEDIRAEPSEYEQLFRPLAQSTLNNIRFESPADALTGPVARGDVGTVRAHLQTLEATAPALLPFLIGLVTETARLAVRSGKLSVEQCEHLLDVAAEMIENRPGRDG